MKKIALVLALVMLSAMACRKAARNEILLGEFSSMSGNTASYGQDNHDGVMMAVDEINASGGVLGKPLAIALEDYRSSPEEGKAAALKLIKRHHVTALIGGVSSGPSLAAGPEAQRHKIPMISPSATNPKVTQIGDFVFRACFIDPMQGDALAKFALGTLKLKKFAILKDIKTDYSVGLAQAFTTTITSLGGVIVNEQAYSEGDVEFRSQLTAIKATHPDAIFIPGYYNEVGLIARQARELGITVPLLGGDGWDSPKLFELGGDSLNNSYFTATFSAEDPDPQVQKFIAQFKARYQRVPSGMAVMGYEATRMLADAIARAGSTDSQKIRDALATTKDFPGLTGKISMGTDRNVKKRMVIIQIENGTPKFYSSIQP